MAVGGGVGGGLRLPGEQEGVPRDQGLGRRLGVTALGDTLADAQKRAYEAVKCIEFPDMVYRRDIAARALPRTPPPPEPVADE